MCNVEFGEIVLLSPTDSVGKLFSTLQKVILIFHGEPKFLGKILIFFKIF